MSVLIAPEQEVEILAPPRPLSVDEFLRMAEVGIFGEDERVELLCGLACTDHVVLFDEGDVRGVIRALRPDVHVKGTDYTPETVPERDEVLAYGGRVAVAGDAKRHSTTDLWNRLRNG